MGWQFLYNFCLNKTTRQVARLIKLLVLQEVSTRSRVQHMRPYVCEFDSKCWMRCHVTSADRNAKHRFLFRPRFKTFARLCFLLYEPQKQKHTKKNRQPRRQNDNTRLLVNRRKTYVLNCSIQSPFRLKFRRTNQISKQICAADKKRGKSHVRISWLVLGLLLMG